MNKMDLERECQIVLKKHKVSRMIALLVSLIFICFGISGMVSEQVADLGSLELHRIIMIFGGASLGTTIANWNKKEIQLIELMRSRLNENNSIT